MNSSFSKSRAVLWMVWGIASVFYAYQYVLRVMPSILLTDIMERFQIDAAAFGQFSGFYYIGYSLMHLPMGMMLDRFGPKKIMTGCIFLTVVGLLPLLWADHWFYPIVGRLLIGIGSSAAILGVFKIIRMTFSENQFPRMLSFSVTIGLIGAIYGGGPVSLMRDSFGSETVIQVFAIAGLGLSLLTYWVIPNIEHPPKTSVWSDVKEVLSNRRVIWTCLSAGLMVGPLEGFADVWGSTFLKQVYGLDGALSSSLPSMIFIGMCFGSPILTFIADKTGYLAAIIGAGVAMTLGFFFLLNGLSHPTTIGTFFAIIGVCCAYQILAIYKSSTYVREQVAGLTTALANMIIMIFGYAFHSIIGTIIDRTGGVASPEALSNGILAIPIGVCMGTIGFILLSIQEKQTISSRAKY